MDGQGIDELPPGRKPITTIHQFDNRRESMYRSVRKQIDEGRQVYIVYPLIKESEKIDLKNLEEGYQHILEEFPKCTVCKVHGKMKPAEKDEQMQLFVAVKVWYPIFQSTLPREERLCAGFSLYLCTDFNPRSHERSDMRSVTQKCINCEFQSTLPREERHAGGANDGDQSDISIHAPTRGATFSSCHKCKL